MATTSENDADLCKSVVWEGDEEVCFGGEQHCLRTSENPKFLAMFFRTDAFNKQKRKFTTGTKVRRVHLKDLAKVIIPLPPLEKQAEIAEILDKFEKLTNDISQGLPAEIAARRKQYEYYRNKLLTFNELS